MTSTWRKVRDHLFLGLCKGITWSAVFILMMLLFHIAKEGLSWLDLQFIESFPSRFPEKAGVKAAIWGSLWLIGLTAAMAIPVGVATALYLQEYVQKSQWSRWIQINIANLAGMPSIIYGLLGLAIFVRFFALEQSLWAGSLTLSLLILPVIIIASQEAIKAVPRSVVMGAYAMGAQRWQVMWGIVLPSALPGIATGVILGLSRAIGESAPMLMIGALSYVAFVPESASDPFTVLPVQIFNWAGRPQPEFHGLAAAGILVLLMVLFSMNFIAVLIRQRFQRYKL